MSKELIAIGNDPESEYSYIIEEYEKVIENKNFSIELRFEYQINPKQKQLVKLTKIPDQYAISMNKDILVQFNAEYFDLIDEDELRTILLEQEIDKIETNLEKGTISIGKHTVSTNIGMVNKWSFEKIQRAVEVEEHLKEQMKDKKSE